MKVWKNILYTNERKILFNLVRGLDFFFGGGETGKWLDRKHFVQLAGRGINREEGFICTEEKAKVAVDVAALQI